MSSSETKVCCACGEAKPIGKFHYKRRKDGSIAYGDTCSPCYRDRRKQDPVAISLDREKARERMRKLRANPDYRPPAAHIGTHVPHAVAEKIKRISSERDVPVAAIVRELIESALAQKGFWL